MKIMDGIVTGAAIGLGIATTAIVLLAATIATGAVVTKNEEKINNLLSTNKNESEVK